MALKMKNPIVIQKTLPDQWIANIHLRGFPDTEYLCEVQLVPYNAETKQYEVKADLMANPEMAFTFDVMKSISNPKVKAAYDAIVEAVDDIQKELLKAKE